MLLKGGDAPLDAVSVSWAVLGTDLQLWVRDCGVGLSDTDNLFVPFFTTKEKGSGIGLLLSRQIVEAHGGHLRIGNRPEGGCEVEIRLPASVIPTESKGRTKYFSRIQSAS